MMLIVLNTASLQIIPTTVISIRSSLGSNNPTQIIFPVWLSTICAAIVGIICCKIIIRCTKKWKEKLYKLLYNNDIWNLLIIFQLLQCHW